MTKDREFELFEKHYPHMYNCSYYLLRNESMAKKLTNRVFARAFDDIEELQTEDNFRSWIFLIFLDIVSRYDKDINSDPIKPEYSDDLKKVLELLHDLDLDYRLLILLKYYLNYDYPKMSTILDDNKESVRTKTDILRKKIYKLLEMRKIKIQEIDFDISVILKEDMENFEFPKNYLNKEFNDSNKLRKKSLKINKKFLLIAILLISLIYMSKEFLTQPYKFSLDLSNLFNNTQTSTSTDFNNDDDKDEPFEDNNFVETTIDDVIKTIDFALKELPYELSKVLYSQEDQKLKLQYKNEDKNIDFTQQKEENQSENDKIDFLNEPTIESFDYEDTHYVLLTKGEQRKELLWTKDGIVYKLTFDYDITANEAKKIIEDL
jgi:DNA-directed RNA polymerase specialized sigma24 family protein